MTPTPTDNHLYMLLNSRRGPTHCRGARHDPKPVIVKVVATPPNLVSSKKLSVPHQGPNRPTALLNRLFSALISRENCRGRLEATGWDVGHA